MSEELLIHLGREAVMTMLQVAGPLLLCGLAAGLSISILQAVTQIQEATLSFIPKIVAVCAALLFFLPWMIQKLVHLTLFLYTDFRIFIT